MNDLSKRVEDTCKWLESGPSVLTADMAHDIRARIAELEAEEKLWEEANRSLGEAREQAEAELEDTNTALLSLIEIERRQAEAALAERDQELGALRDVYQELTGKDWRWDSRARAEEGSG